MPARAPLVLLEDARKDRGRSHEDLLFFSLSLSPGIAIECTECTAAAETLYRVATIVELYFQLLRCTGKGSHSLLRSL